MTVDTISPRNHHRLFEELTDGVRIGSLNVNMKQAGAKGPKKSKGSDRKYGQNCVGHTPGKSKWVATGGPRRMEARKARNLSRQAKLHERAEARRNARIERRLDSRILKAASEYLEAIS
jgi:hypothetical protein